MNSCEGLSPLKCLFCVKSFANYVNLIKHQKTHEPITSFIDIYEYNDKSTSKYSTRSKNKIARILSERMIKKSRSPAVTKVNIILKFL